MFCQFTIQHKLAVADTQKAFCLRITFLYSQSTIISEDIHSADTYTPYWSSFATRTFDYRVCDAAASDNVRMSLPCNSSKGLIDLC